MRLKFILKIHQFSKNLGFVLVAFVFKGFPFVIRLCKKGFSEVADWLRVQESLKSVLALG